MANICDFELKAVGKSVPDLISFYKEVSANYIYSKDPDNPKVWFESHGVEEEVEHHLYRVNTYRFRDPISEAVEEEDDGFFSITISGECAWSVKSCMIGNDPFCYHSPDRIKGTTLCEQAARYGIRIEVFSSEPGMCFMEHYLISEKGELLAEECVEYQEICLDDFESKEEAEEAIGESIPERVWENEDWYEVGGMEWAYSI